MIFGLDFDGTYATAKPLWDGFITLALQQGHQVILVTNRDGTPEDLQVLEQWLNGRIPVLYARGRPKRVVAREAGYEVHVWIDDYPILVDYGAYGLAMTGYHSERG